MSTQTFDSNQARARWREVLALARDEGTDVLIERYGRPEVALISYQDYLAVQAELSGLRRAREGRRPAIRTDHPHVVRIEGHHGGDPVISGSGISVQAIVEQTHLGLSPEGIAELYDGALDLAEVHDALSYYHEHTREIDAGIAEDLAILERGPQTGDRP